MTNQHPITPPPELVEQWRIEWCDTDESGTFAAHLATRAAQWGADQELGACCWWLAQFNYDDYCYHDKLRAARRPKPPSLAEEAFVAKQHLMTGPWRCEDWELIHRALERLQELEGDT